MNLGPLGVIFGANRFSPYLNMAKAAKANPAAPDSAVASLEQRIKDNPSDLNVSCIFQKSAVLN